MMIKKGKKKKIYHELVGIKANKLHSQKIQVLL
jgi:hypothetical protein